MRNTAWPAVATQDMLSPTSRRPFTPRLNAAAAALPTTRARAPSRASPAAPSCGASLPAPSPPRRSTSAAATPSGNGRVLSTTIARRSGIEYITPSRPPSRHTPVVCQNAKRCQWPIMTSAGSTRITLHSVPAAEAWVCTMLFSRMVPPPIARSSAMEITAAGIEEEKVIPVLRPM